MDGILEEEDGKNEKKKKKFIKILVLKNYGVFYFLSIHYFFYKYLILK